ncbi:hypothetical protein ABZS29_02585 [Kribbella sp. NPDC005582]|uniref:hypothetical protein n=1 Tax=Kribbella sp. NPDC005582 TaxID=3156893 RepID=UPI0033B200CF
MAVVMGEASAEVWAEEYGRTSRVEFTRRAKPYRREMFWLMLSALGLGIAGVVVPDARRWIVLVTVVALGRSAWAGAQLVGNRLLLLVDANGIRYGDTRLEWEQIGAIGLPHAKTLEIIAKDTETRSLTIRHWAVRDLSALAGWLEDVLKQHRIGDAHADHG